MLVFLFSFCLLVYNLLDWAPLKHHHYPKQWPLSISKDLCVPIMFFSLFYYTFRRTRLNAFLSDSRRCECVFMCVYMCLCARQYAVHAVFLCAACIPLTNVLLLLFWSCLACVRVFEFNIHKTGFRSLVLLLLLLQRKTFFSANNGKSFQHFEAVLCCSFELFSVGSVSLSSLTSSQHQHERRYTNTNTWTNKYAQTYRRHTYKQREKNTYKHKNTQALISHRLFSRLAFYYSIQL